MPFNNRPNGNLNLRPIHRKIHLQCSIPSLKRPLVHRPRTTRDPPNDTRQTRVQDHSRRHQVWDQGFSSRALRDYRPRVSRYTDQLIQAINRGIGLGKPMDVLRWFNYYSFDVMGDLSLGSLLVCLLRGGMGMF